MSETSREAYQTIKDSKIPSESNQCLAIFQGRPDLWFSHRDIAKATGLAVNVAESRCSRLKNKGLIEYVGKYRDSHTLMRVQKYRLVKHKNKPQQIATKEATT